MPQLCSVRNPTSGVYPSPGSLAPSSACVRWAGAVLVTLLGLFVTPGWAIDDERSREPCGDSRVWQSPLKSYSPGWNATGYQAAASKRCKSASPASRDSCADAQGRHAVVGAPVLYVLFKAVMLPDQLVTLYLDVVLFQKASLETGEMTYLAATWSVDTLGAVPPNDFPRVHNTNQRLRRPIYQRLSQCQR